MTKRNEQIFEAGKVFATLEDLIAAGLAPSVVGYGPDGKRLDVHSMTIGTAYAGWKNAGIKKWHGRWVWA